MITIEEAIILAVKAHRGQKDLDGKPVILHPLSVALKGTNDKEIIAGLLHDVVEDSTYSFEDLENYGIDNDILEALRLLTHCNDESYDDYIDRIIKSGNVLALTIKRNDLECNLLRNNKSTNNKRRIYDKHKKAINKVNRASR